jgi:hypothetical protein
MTDTSRLSERIVGYKAIVLGYSIFLIGLALVILPPTLGAIVAVTSILQVLGVALMPVGMISLVNEYFIRRDVVKQLSSLFDDFLIGHMDDLIRVSQGVAKVFDANPTAEVNASLDRAEREVFFFNGWIPDIEGLQHGLRTAISKRLDIKFLLLAPDSQVTTSRAAEIGGPRPHDQHYYTQIDLDNLVRLIDSAGGAPYVEIRLYDEMLMAPIYATETEMYVGWFYKARRAVAGPTVRIDGASAPLYVAMRESFVRTWNSPTTSHYYPEVPGDGAKPISAKPRE